MMLSVEVVPKHHPGGLLVMGAAGTPLGAKIGTLEGTKCRDSAGRPLQTHAEAPGHPNPMHSVALAGE